MTVTDLDARRVEQQITDRLNNLRRLQDAPTRRRMVDAIQDAAMTTFDVEPLVVAQQLGVRLGHPVNVTTLVELADALSEYDRTEDGPTGPSGRFWFDRAESLTCSILAGPSIPCATDLFGVGA